MLNLNLNTLSSKLTEQPRGVFTGLVSASFVLYGGGGPGGHNANGGGGGGAAMVVSSSFHVVPNVTYTVIVGAATSGSEGSALVKGEDSFLYGFNELASIPMSAKAGGGQPGAFTGSGESALDGGDSGDGYVYLSSGVSSSYPSISGGSGDITSDSFGIYYAAGGGAGSSQPGINGIAEFLIGGGGSGSLIISSSFQTFGYYSSSYVIDPYFASGDGIEYALGAAGGGAAGNSTGPGGFGERGFYGGGPANSVANRSANGPGAGGAGNPHTGGPSGNGGDGRCFLIYCGVPKMDVTNATTTYDEVHNRTIHIFNKGTGSFYFDFEKYGAILGCQ